MSLVKEFKTFIAKGNVVDLAVAVVIGGAFGKIVSAMVEAVVMPLVGYVLPGGDWKTATIGKLEVGKVLGATVDFLLVALVVFLVFVKGLSILIRRHKDEAQVAVSSKACPRCLENIPMAATRCKFCTSELES